MPHNATASPKMKTKRSLAPLPAVSRPICSRRISTAPCGRIPAKTAEEIIADHGGTRAQIDRKATQRGDGGKNRKVGRRRPRPPRWPASGPRRSAHRCAVEADLFRPRQGTRHGVGDHGPGGFRVWFTLCGGRLVAAAGRPEKRLLLGDPSSLQEASGRVGSRSR